MCSILSFVVGFFSGTLEFIPLLSPRTLEVGDNTFSERISTIGPFPFGKESEFYVYVRFAHCYIYTLYTETKCECSPCTCVSSQEYVCMSILL